MITVLALLCLASTPRTECTVATAYDFVRAEPARSLAECQVKGTLALADRPGAWPEGAWPKVLCTMGERLPRSIG